MCKRADHQLIARAPVGPIIILAGAFLFAAANITAKTVYMHGVSVLSLFIVRGIVVYLMNVALEAGRSGRAAAARVATLQVGSARIARLCCLRSVSGFSCLVMLNVSFQLITLADAFALLLCASTFVTMVLARVVLGTTERLSVHIVSSGAVGILGVLLITQPQALFSGSSPPATGGVVLASAAGVVFSAFNVLSRVLGRAATESGGRSAASPAMLLSYYMVVVELGSLIGAVAIRLAGASEAAPPWARMAMPTDGRTWALTGVYCVCILLGQLLLARGYGMLPAGRAAILALSELCFAWVLDVSVLREPTNSLAAAGTATVFIGCALAASGSVKRGNGPPTATAGGGDAANVADGWPRRALAASDSAVAVHCKGECEMESTAANTA